MVGPGNGDDSQFNKVTVTYDDNTVFVIKIFVTAELGKR